MMCYYCCLCKFKHQSAIFPHNIAPEANCQDGEIRIIRELTMVGGRLEYCDNKVWFSLQYRNWQDPWNSDLVCASLEKGCPGL